MKKSKVISFLLTFIMILSACVSYVPDGMSFVNAAEDDSVLIEYQKTDLNVIPDKYNTGATGKLDKFVGGEKLVEVTGKTSNGECKIIFKKSGAEATYNIDFKDENLKKLSGTIQVENFDFSKYTINTIGDSTLNHKLTIIFNNCKFGRVSKDYEDSQVTYEFNNCSFIRCIGSNYKFDRCSFGGTYEDGLVPFRNVEIKNSYFSDMNHSDPEKVTHIDGTQIYGKDKIDVNNIRYSNCRFEIPNILFENNQATVNSCIMLQLEYSDAYNVSFEDCILNGGSYSIFARSKKGDKLLKNVSFKNIKIGASKYNGAIYPNIDPNVNFKGISGTDSLYIGSVYKERGKTFFSVSNDTARTRKLTIITDKASRSYSLEGSPTKAELSEMKIKSFDEMPLDRLVSVSEDCKYAVCLDVTDQNNIKQIRFVNFSDEDVYLDKKALGIADGFEDKPIAEGTCGSNLYYKISKDYVLTISGKGKMDDYHSAKPVPWADYKDFIKKIVIEDGVESIGNQAFSGCFGLEEVILGKDVKSIGARSFANCNTLTDINLRDDIKISENAFVAVAKKIVDDKTSDTTEPSPTNPTDQNVAAAPKLTIVNTGKKVKIKWTKVSGANTYTVERTVKGKNNFKKIGKTNGANTFVDNKAKNGTAYQYRVTAMKGGKKLSVSKSVTFVCVNTVKITSLTNKNVKNVTLKWKRNAKAGGYQIQYSTNKNFAKKKTVKVGSKVSKKIFKKMKKGKTYYIRIRAYKKVGGKVYYSGWVKKKIKVKK